MNLSVADIATLSNLLDEALEMPEAEHGAWLSGLSAQHGPLLPRLREMLAERTGVDDDLGRFPPLDARANRDIVAAGEQVGPTRSAAAAWAACGSPNGPTARCAGASL